MSLISSVCMISHYTLTGSKDMDLFFEKFNTTLDPYVPVPERSRGHVDSPKGPEIDVRVVGYNYLDVEAFHSAFKSYPWDEVPTLMIRENESDLMRVMLGDLTVGEPKNTIPAVPCAEIVPDDQHREGGG